MNNYNPQYVKDNNFYKCYKDNVEYYCNNKCNSGTGNGMCNLNILTPSNISVKCPKTWIKTPYSGWLSEIKNK